VSSAGLAEAVRAATSTSVFADDPTRLVGCRSGLVRMFGSAAGVVYRTEEAETARRRVQKVEPLTELDVLDGLMGLPVGVPVAVVDLTERECARLRRIPHGAVEHDGDQVVRRAVAPLSVRFALVGARDWRVGLTRAGRFAPYCARAVLLPAAAAQAEWGDVRAQASFFGIGVCVFAEGQLRVLVEPRPYVRMRHTPAQWWFVEETYRQISECEIGEEPAPSSRARREGRPRP
jgi:hypothetical protein